MPDKDSGIPKMYRPAPREPRFAAPLPDEPADITLAFFADYKDWNTFAMHSQGLPEGTADARRVYDALIAKYCPPGKQRQGLAFGSRATHSPYTSRITGERQKGDHRIVVTETVENESYRPVYEFEYVGVDGRWMLEEVYFVDDGGSRKRRLRVL